PHLLLLDPDATAREALASELLQAGVDVTGAADLDGIPAELQAQATMAVDAGALPLDWLGKLRARGQPLYVATRAPDAAREQALLGAGATQVVATGPACAGEIARLLALAEPPEPEPTEMEGPFTPEGL